MSDVPAPGDGPCQCGPCVARAGKRTVRAWRWIASLDLTKPPAPLLRWLGIVLTGAVYAAAGAPTDLSGWIWAAVLGGALILPDVAGFAVGGFRLDLKQAQDDIATLRQEVNAQARATAHAGAVVAMGDSAFGALPGLSTIGEIVSAGQPGAAGTALPLSTAGSAMDASHEEDVRS